MRICLNPPDMRIVHAIPFGESRFRLIAGSDCGNVIVRKSAVPMIKPVIVSPLFCRISIVLGFGSDLQMSGVDARRVIASVHDDHTLWNWPNVKLIRIPMSASWLFSRHQKNAISVFVSRSLPRPTASCFFKAAFKHILRAKQRILMQSRRFSSAAVTTAAQFTRDRFTGPTLNARELGFGLISHRLPPVACSL